jgi:hypothetical protein
MLNGRSKKLSDKVSIDYVVKTFAEIPDSTISWSESDVRCLLQQAQKRPRIQTRNQSYGRIYQFPGESLFEQIVAAILRALTAK